MIGDLARVAALLALVLPHAVSAPAAATPHSPPPRMLPHASPSPVASPTPRQEQTPKAQDTSSVDPQILSLAKEWFRRFQIGDIDRTQLSDTVNKQLTLAMIRREAAQLKPLGNPLSVTFIRSYPISGMLGYDFQLQFKSVRIIEMIAFDGSGKIAGIDFLTLAHN
jgi:hypothetical protein